MTRFTCAAALVAAIATGSFGVLAQGPPAGMSTISPAEWQQKHALALKHRTAWDLYLALRQTARGGQQPPPLAAELPDWSGLWTTAGGGFAFAAAPGGVTPKLTPAAAEALKAGREQAAKGISYDDNLSQCGPAGHPRWLREPFLREFVAAPSQTWLISEQVQEIRRIYTDGRDHTPEADRYPLALGDSIGFWDGPRLVIHTNQLMARVMDRNAPEQSDKMETVEVWEKVNPTTINVDAWLYDPAVYEEPWYIRPRFTLVPNPDKSLRIRYWDCSENPNNAVVKTPDGNTEFKGFTFTRPEKSQR
jgi:hypothetical protein